MFLGQLDQREVRSLISSRKRLMVLCPHGKEIYNNEMK